MGKNKNKTVMTYNDVWKKNRESWEIPAAVSPY